MSGPRTYASFDADFPDELGPDNEPPGRELATAVRDGLVRRGLDCDELEAMEEFAYSIECRQGKGNWHLLVGHVGDSHGRQWLISVNSLKSGLFRKAGLGPEGVTTALHAVLTDDLGVAPQWFTRDEWEAPGYVTGAPAPD